MPTVSVGRDRLFAALGESYTQEQFEELCFDFGIELDDVTTEKAIVRKEKHLDEEATEDEEVIYKIEVPANRYDLLCLEGLAQALRIFVGKEEVPNYKVLDVPIESRLKMHVKPETSLIRPFVVCAVLRGITFDEARYNSFIDLQDRLHQNLCRKRTLVAIGTHDLDTLQGPFTYEALAPSEIKFVPLKQVKEFRANELMEYYRTDLKLKKFLHIIENSPVFPVIYDKKRTVLSLPPIINSAHSAITLKTKNVFIECTATDLTKAKIVLNTMVTAFSVYCERKFEVEPVEVVTPDKRSSIYPDLLVWNMEVDLAYINRSIGVPLQVNKVVNLLNRMQLSARQIDSQGKKSNICVSVPPTRSDILHQCDIMEDVAIAYGFNNIPKTKPKSLTQGRQQALNHISDLIRSEIAMAGFTEVLTWILCSHEENFTMVNRKDDKRTAVVIGNPRSSEFEIARTSLLPGILKTMGHNKDHPRPIKIFEVGDIVILDNEKDVGATNRRHLAALYCNSNSGFEVVHGLVDRIMFLQSGYDLMATVVSACTLHNPHAYGPAIRKLRRDSTQLPLSAPCCSATHPKAPSSSTKFCIVTKSANNQLSPQTIQGEVSLSSWAPLMRIPRHFNNVELAASATIALAVVVALVRALRLAAKKPVRALKAPTEKPVQIHSGESLQSNQQNAPSKIGEDANAVLSDKPIFAYRVASLSEERNFPSLQELQNTGSPKQAQGGLWAGDRSESFRPNEVNFGEITAADNSVALALLAEPRESPFMRSHPGESACNFHVPSPPRGPVRSCPEEIIPRALAVGLSSWDRPPIEDEVNGTLCPTENPPSDSITEDSCEDDEDDLAVNGNGLVHLSEAEANTALIVSSPLADANSLLQPSYLGSDVDSQPVPVIEPLNMNVNAKQEKQSSLNRNRTIQAAVPIIAIGAGALGAVMGVEGAMEMVGVVATVSFVTYELLWAQTRKRLWEDLESVTDHKKLTSFLKSRDIIKHFKAHSLDS